jgi:uncharacterized protein (DUF1778 family)
MYVPCEYNRAMSQLESAGRGRINIRVDAEQEAKLRAAAEANGETLTAFLLAAATKRADQVLREASRIEVSGQAFKRFLTALEGRVEPMPTVSRYASERSPFQSH